MLAMKRIRDAKGLTQNDLCIRTGIPASRISLIETGKVKPLINTAQRIAEALGSTTDEVFKEEGVA